MYASGSNCWKHSCFEHSYQRTEADRSVQFLEWTVTGRRAGAKTIRGWTGIQASATDLRGEYHPFTGLTWGTHQGIQLLELRYAKIGPYPVKPDWAVVYRQHNPYNVGGFVTEAGARPNAYTLGHPDMRTALYRVRG